MIPLLLLLLLVVHLGSIRQFPIKEDAVLATPKGCCCFLGVLFLLLCSTVVSLSRGLLNSLSRPFYPSSPPPKLVLGGAVMNLKFMMEFTNSCRQSCKFPLRPPQPKQDWRPNLQSKISSLQKLTIPVWQLHLVIFQGQMTWWSLSKHAKPQ